MLLYFLPSIQNIPSTTFPVKVHTSKPIPNFEHGSENIKHHMKSMHAQEKLHGGEKGTESRHGSTRVPIHAFLSWRGSWRMVVNIIFQQLEIPSARSWAAPVRATDRKGRRYHPSIMYKIKPARFLSSSYSQVGRRVWPFLLPSATRWECHCVSEKVELAPSEYNGPKPFVHKQGEGSTNTTCASSIVIGTELAEC